MSEAFGSFLTSPGHSFHKHQSGWSKAESFTSLGLQDVILVLQHLPETDVLLKSSRSQANISPSSLVTPQRPLPTLEPGVLLEAPPSLSTQTWHHFEDSAWNVHITNIPQKLLAVLLGSSMLVVSGPPPPPNSPSNLLAWPGGLEPPAARPRTPELSPRTTTTSATAALFCFY